MSKHGALSYNQCFGFVPLLALGGFKDVDHMDKVKSPGAHLPHVPTHRRVFDD